MNRVHKFGFGLMILNSVTGCHFEKSHVSVYSKTVRATASPPKPSSYCSLSMLWPSAEDRVPMVGAFIRFKVNGKLPPGAQPMVYIRDATGLDTNWWAWPAQEAGTGLWQAKVQFGEPQDSGQRLAVQLFILSKADCPTPGQVGFLPTKALAKSRIVEIIRE